MKKTIYTNNNSKDTWEPDVLVSKENYCKGEFAWDCGD